MRRITLLAALVLPLAGCSPRAAAPALGLEPGREVEVVDRGQLVVGGGDAAIEAATSVAEQPGTTVTLSYRGDAFGRAKEKNRARLAQLYGDDASISLTDADTQVLYQSDFSAGTSGWTSGAGGCCPSTGSTRSLACGANATPRPTRTCSRARRGWRWPPTRGRRRGRTCSWC